DALICKRGFAAVGAALGGSDELARLANNLHADAAATASRFDQDRVTYAFRLERELLGSSGRHRSVAARRRRAPDRTRHGARTEPVAKRLERSAGRTNEREARGANLRCEAGVLAEQAIARVNRFSAALERRRKHQICVQVAVRERRRPKSKRLICGGDVRR